MAKLSVSRWRVARGMELTAYAGCVAVIMWRIPTVCSELWLRECTANRQCGRFLREGWLGPTLDGADDQWRELRESLPLIFAAIVGHGVLSFLVRLTCPPPSDSVQSADRAHPKLDGTPDRDSALNKTEATGTPRSLPPPIPMGELGRRRVLLNVAASVAFAGLMHGTHAVFPAGLVFAAFMVGHALRGTRLAQPVTWAMAVGFIWLKERWFHIFTFHNFLGAGYAGLDRFQGMHPWRLSFNLVVLRVVSFNIDLHWAELQSVQNGATSAWIGQEQKAKGGRGSVEGPSKEERDVYDYSSRVLAHRPMSDYSLWHCLTYVFYAPLYLAGPTLTFNAFVSHMACPQRSYGWGRMTFYLTRIAFALLLLEWGVHNLPVFALARSGTLNFGPGILGLFVYTILLIMWLKFLVIWRVFRFWALCDGVEPPENMMKCMSNNYSVVGFWKGWHCSFNKWLVRYIYVPLGGSKPGRRWNVFVVFAFVSFWHDVEPKLFMWGLLNGVFFVLEALMKELYRRSAALESCRAHSLANRMVQALGATSNVMALLLVNMIGYAAGIQKTGRVADGIFIDGEGVVVAACGFAFFFSGVQLMFVIEEFKERGKRSTTAYKKVVKS
eukprot:jgi/Undpi1/9045/HiC_scaffold_26.g11505.m1